LIDSALLESDADIDTLARGVEIVRTILKTSPIANLIEEETAPGSDIEGLAALREYLRDHTGLSCHPIGTCRMGTGADAVVDPNLRVRGLENLWVADASIMPDHLSANINAPCMMIGAKLGKALAARA
jgi:choline dehydrogenase-like flavoprotein